MYRAGWDCSISVGCDPVVEGHPVEVAGHRREECGKPGKLLRWDVGQDLGDLGYPRSAGPTASKTPGQVPGRHLRSTRQRGLEGIGEARSG